MGTIRRRGDNRTLGRSVVCLNMLALIILNITFSLEIEGPVEVDHLWDRDLPDSR